MAEVKGRVGVWSPLEVWSPEKAAELLGCTPDHVRLLCRRGELQAIRERRRWYVEPNSVRRRLQLRAQGELGFRLSGGG